MYLLDMTSDGLVDISNGTFGTLDLRVRVGSKISNPFLRLPKE